MTKKTVTMVVDLQFGSTGKGLLAGYLGDQNRYDVVVAANMPNAGHTFIDAKGNKFINKVLPSAAATTGVHYVLIGPGAVFDPERLKLEINEHRQAGYLASAQIIIHPASVPLKKEHKELEEDLSELHKIGSTKQGSSAAMVEKIFRLTDAAVISRDVFRPMEWKNYGVEVVTQERYYNILSSAKQVLAEGAQGFSLGINEEFYPYCTSRDCSPARFLSDMAIPWDMLDKVIGSARAYPIRVGGESGGCYDDQKELTWEDVGVPPETTTVTGRERRVFSFSYRQIYDAINRMGVDEVFLNFCNYLKRPEYEIMKIPSLKYTGWGPTINDIKTV